ncbi:MAG TPA: S-adenosylmethionine:tRNA ribosyltransferase-isomerase [Mycobacteriales bacterium]|nr:S-adenosylmethionine:tRNA ribosyltransferase-isomerase [Mycobacteriales bacterium]
MTALAAPAVRFELPAELEATTPAEHRGLARDDVRMLVVRPGLMEHRRAHDLADVLVPGDLVVVNATATLPAALDGARYDGRPATVHVAPALDDGSWVVEVRRPDNRGPAADVHVGETLCLPGDLLLHVTAAHPDPLARSSRLWRVTPVPGRPLIAYLTEHGRPITYGYVRRRYPLADYQTVFASEPGSSEMASAGRPFTADLVTRLIARGIGVAPIVLHTGLSSPEVHELPSAERFRVPEAAAAQVNATIAAGHRVVAVGTTVVRALESAADVDGVVHAAEGWTDLVLGPHRPAGVVNGLLTGWHAPEASHLLLLEAVAGRELVQVSYPEALDHRYLWHEFGDVALYLP